MAGWHPLPDLTVPAPLLQAPPPGGRVLASGRASDVPVPSMSVATRVAFDLLLGRFRPGVVADVGSRDGLDARRFADALPDALVLAFEANPANVARMQADPALSAAGVRVVPLAAAARTGTVTFHVVDAAPGDVVAAGQSSLLPRAGAGVRQVPVTVDAVRLDEYLATERPGSPVALWVDVEGAAGEVLQGIEGVRERVDVVHVELETHPFWEGQALAPDVVRAMEELGFEVLLGAAAGATQEDTLFVRRDLRGAHPVQLRVIVLLARAAERLARHLGQPRRAALRRGLTRASRVSTVTRRPRR